MVVKRRSPGQVAISISMTEEMVELIDARAEALGLTRSGYLAALARADVAAGGDLTLRETPNSGKVQTAVEQTVSYLVDKTKKHPSKP